MITDINLWFLVGITKNCRSWCKKLFWQGHRCNYNFGTCFSDIYNNLPNHDCQLSSYVQMNTNLQLFTCKVLILIFISIIPIFPWEGWQLNGFWSSWWGPSVFCPCLITSNRQQHCCATIIYHFPYNHHHHHIHHLHHHHPHEDKVEPQSREDHLV